MLKAAPALSLIIASIWPLVTQAQEIPFVGGDGDGRTVLAVDHQTTSAASSRPNFYTEEQRAFFALPLYKNEEGSTYSFIFRGTRTLLGEKLVFKDRNVETPEGFGTAEAGISWFKRIPDGSSRSLSVTYGSAGRRLLDSGLTPILNATFTAEVASSKNRSWFFFLNYSNNRVLLNHIPIPGVAYVIKEQSYFIILGVPFFFGLWRWDPVYMSLATSPFFVSGEVSYRFWGPLLIYANAGWRPKSYQNLVERSDDRLIFDRKDAAAGLKAFFGKNGSLSLGYVWTFDRRFMLGRSIADRHSEAVTVDNAAGFQISGRLNF